MQLDITSAEEYEYFIIVVVKQGNTFLEKLMESED